MKLCSWCQVVPVRERGQRFCSRKCRQAAFRLRKLSGGREGVGPGLPAGATFVYADPPYPGTARKYYGDQPTYKGEVDHVELLRRITEQNPCGWALSTSEPSLRWLLPLCPQGVEVCPWVKPIGVPPATYGRHNTWEPVLVWGGRRIQPGIRDWLDAQPARLWGDLPGRKPIAFCAWLFDLLGMVPGDQLVDMFPGTGMVARAWKELGAVQPVQATLDLSLTPGEPKRAPMLPQVYEPYSVDERQVG